MKAWGFKPQFENCHVRCVVTRLKIIGRGDTVNIAINHVKGVIIDVYSVYFNFYLKLFMLCGSQSAGSIKFQIATSAATSSLHLARTSTTSTQSPTRVINPEEYEKIVWQ